MADPLIRNGCNQDLESFHKFFECWLSEQNQYLEELVSALKQYETNNNNNSSSSSSSSSTDQQEKERLVLIPLIDRVMKHYEHYYNSKSRWSKKGVLAMLNPSWRSSLEDAFAWVGGWRPTMAFHLLYSMTGLQLEARLADMIRGLATGDLGDLSLSQLSQVDELQRRTVREEKEINETLAKHQEAIADPAMVELSHQVTELMRAGETSQEPLGAEEERVNSALTAKEEGLVEALQMADDLRLRTIREVINILNPVQVVHFLIAAAELHQRIHDWGTKRDDAAAAAAPNMHHRGGGGAADPS